MAKFRRQSLSEHLAEWRQLLRANNFGWLWVGQVLSQIGDGVSKVALLFFVYDLTGSALKMTVIGILKTIHPSCSVLSSASSSTGFPNEPR